MASLVTMVAAMSLNRAIGVDNQLPWRLKEDMALFKKNTLGKTVLMGRNTAFSIGRPLPKRTNLVLTSHDLPPYPGQSIVHSIEQAIETTEGELVIIGGSQVYAAALPYTDRLYLSVVDAVIRDADAFFPEFDMGLFRQSVALYFAKKEDEEFGFEYMELERINGKVQRGADGTGTGADVLPQAGDDTVSSALQEVSGFGGYRCGEFAVFAARDGGGKSRLLNT